MALGDVKGRSNSNGSSNKLYENTYYSRVGFKDYEIQEEGIGFWG